jgi:hypothetical protein
MTCSTNFTKFTGAEAVPTIQVQRDLKNKMQPTTQHNSQHQPKKQYTTLSLDPASCRTFPGLFASD